MPVRLRLLSSVRWIPLLFPASLLSLLHYIRLSPGFFRFVDLRCSVAFLSSLLPFRYGWVPMQLFRDSGSLFGYSVIITCSPPSDSSD